MTRCKGLTPAFFAAKQTCSVCELLQSDVCTVVQLSTSVQRPSNNATSCTINHRKNTPFVGRSFASATPCTAVAARSQGRPTTVGACWSPSSDGPWSSASARPWPHRRQHTATRPSRRAQTSKAIDDGKDCGTTAALYDLSGLRPGW